MNENKKTITFLAAAIVAVAIASLTSPTKRDPSAKPNVMGQSLFESFDPRAVTGIEIVEVDEDDIQSKSIEVTQTDKGWFIKRPGKADYPANADNQLKDVASILFDLRIIDQAGEGAGEHSRFGVLDPSKVADLNSSGDFTLELVAFGEGNVTIAVSETVVFRVSPFTGSLPPRIKISEPRKSFTSKSVFPLSASADDPDGAIHSITFYVNGVAVKTGSGFEEILRTRINYKQDDWESLLSVIMFVVNNQTKVLLHNKTPIEIEMAITPIVPADLISRATL